MRENVYIHWYGTGDVFFYGKPSEIYTGLCGILTGACKFLDTDLESLITAVYTAMQETDPDCDGIKTILKKEDREGDKTIVSLDRDGCAVLNGTGGEIMAAFAVLAERVCDKSDLKLEDFICMLRLGFQMAAEKDSAPVDGSDAERKEGIT